MGTRLWLHSAGGHTECEGPRRRYSRDWPFGALPVALPLHMVPYHLAVQPKLLYSTVAGVPRDGRQKLTGLARGGPRKGTVAPLLHLFV